jgi:hypothetical protein
MGKGYRPYDVRLLSAMGQASCHKMQEVLPREKKRAMQGRTGATANNIVCMDADGRMAIPDATLSRQESFHDP